ncbi:hypothetical protein C265_26228 [Cupriavidus sp. GA3-3]|nr:hypothetical protein C265_26228 [Cupriavidus sp. GA3-3]
MACPSGAVTDTETLAVATAVGELLLAFSVALFWLAVTWTAEPLLDHAQLLTLADTSAPLLSTSDTLTGSSCPSLIDRLLFGIARL